MSSLSPEQLTALKRLSWESKNDYRFREAFSDSQEAGCTRHGMKFVKAQEAALSAINGGIFRELDPMSEYQRAFISTMVLAVLDTVLPCREKVKS